MHYTSFEEHEQIINGKRNIKTLEVNIQNNKGIKRVSIQGPSGFAKHEEQLSATEINNILGRKFIPGLFKSCNNKCTARLKGALQRRRTRRAKK